MFALCSYISSLAKKENAAREAAELAAKVDRKEWDDSSIGYLLQHASTNLVHPGYRPVLIYRYRTTNHGAFTAVGTWFQGKSGPLVVTVEHLLQKKFSDELFVIRFLSPDEHTATNGLVEVAYRNVEAGLPADNDVVFIRPTQGEAKRLPCFTERAEEMPQEVEIKLFDHFGVAHGTVRNLTSLVTGMAYPVVGGTDAPRHIAIAFDSKAGHSGTGFVDEYGQLYVLSGGPRNTVNGLPISLLTGPYANPEKRL